MLKFQVKAETQARLKQLSSPRDVMGGANQGIVWSFHDTATYTSGVTTNLQFFTTARATRQLSNLSPPGSLPEPQYFKVYAFQLDPLVPTDYQAFRDVDRLLFGSGAAGEGAPTFQFTLADKVYGPWPLSLLHGTGGAMGHAGTTVAAESNWLANNSIPDGGYWQDGAICIPPSQNFSAEIVWGAAQTLVANRDLRVTMSGVLYRAIV